MSNSQSQIKKATDVQSQVSIDVKDVDNAVLRRLIEEVNFERENKINSYNRTHNRHNRGR